MSNQKHFAALFRIVSRALLTTAMVGCFRGPAFFAKSSDTAGTKNVSISNFGGGVAKGNYDPSKKVTQVFAVEQGELTGVSLSISPGSLNVATEITLQPGATVASTGLGQELGIASDKNFQPSGLSIVLSSSESIDPGIPMRLSIPVASSALNLLGDGKYFVIAYIVKVAATGETRAGIIPSNKIRLNNGRLDFEAPYFGGFQAATVDLPINEAFEKITSRKPTTKQEVEGMALVVDDIVPLVAATGTEIKLLGKNFRSSMTIALGDKTVGELNVKSDVSATFKMPQLAFGPTKVKISQDGISDTGPYFALSDKTGYPLITLAASAVCKGITFYDIEGVKKEGARECGGGSSDGGSVAAASTLSLGTSPSEHYKITGSGTSITSISSADAGTKVSLLFDGAVQLVHSANLLLPKNASYWTASGDVAILLSLGGGIWKVASLAANHDAFVTLTFPSTFTFAVGSTAASYTSSTGAFNSTTDDQSNFSNATYRFTAKKTGWYLIKGVVNASETAACGVTPSITLGVYRNGGATSIGSVGFCSTSGTSCAYSPPSGSSPVFVKSGDYLEFKYDLYLMTPGSCSFDFATGAANNSVEIRIVNELQ